MYQYILQARLTSTRDGICEQTAFQHSYFIKFLGKTGMDAFFYNEKLKMHFTDERALVFQYEVETTDLRVSLPKRISKADEFVRRTNYRFNWIQPSLNMKGELVQINNFDALVKSWNRLESVVSKDNKGESVDKYLKTIDQEFADDKSLCSTAFQYLFFGLVFPNIPARHRPAWENKRVVKFSGYEEEIFEEHIIYDSEIDGVRIYKIDIASSPGSKFTIEECEGDIHVRNNSFLPERAEVMIKYRVDDFELEWSFSLDRL